MAESLTFNVGADTKNFQDGINGLLGKLAGLVAAFVSAQAIIEAFGQAIDLGGRLHDLSTRTGETAGNLAILERAFENTGVSADKVGPAINKMQKSLEDAADGTGAAADALKQLGLSFQDLENHSPTEQLQIIGQRLAAIEDPAQRSAAAMSMFGKSGGELLPILINFGTEIEGAKTQLGSLPELLDKTAAEVDSLGDNLAAIRNKGTEMAYGFLSEVVPAIEAFTGKLAGVDAASIGVGLADALVGAFVNPMKAAELFGQSLNLGVKTMGNELVFQVQYWSQLMFNTFSAIGTNIIPMLGNNMRGAFELAVGSFGTILVDVIAGAMEGLRGIAGPLGFGDELTAAIEKVLGVHQTLDTVMAQGAARLEESSLAFAGAFENAQASSTVVRQDFFGAGEAAQGIADAFAGLQEDVRNAMSAFDSSDAASGRTTTGTDTTLLDTLTAIDAISESTADFGATAAVAGAHVSNAVSSMNAQLSLLASINPNQLIGPSASAREADALDQKIKELIASGEDPSSQRIQSLERLRDKHRDIATGVNATSADREEARQRALDEIFEGSDKSLKQLEEEALKEILDEKRREREQQDEQDKKRDEQQEKAKEEDDKPKSFQQMVQQVVQIMQKIEPRIPVANLA